MPLGLHINSIVGLGFGRPAYELYGGAGTVENPWRLIMLGDPSNEIRIVDDEGSGTFSVFPFDTAALPPAGFSPTGDLVRVSPNPHQYDTFPFPPTSTVTMGRPFEAVTWAWGASSQLDPAAAFALLYVVGENGKPDRWFFAVPTEIELLKKNPLFP